MAFSAGIERLAAGKLDGNDIEFGVPMLAFGSGANIQSVDGDIVDSFDHREQL